MSKKSSKDTLFLLKFFYGKLEKSVLSTFHQHLFHSFVAALGFCTLCLFFCGMNSSEEW